MQLSLLFIFSKGLDVVYKRFFPFLPIVSGERNHFHCYHKNRKSNVDPYLISGIIVCIYKNISSSNNA